MNYNVTSQFLIDLWKATAIGVTGVLGVMGLITEFRNKETGSITTAGRWTLALILISTALGALAQVVDSSNQEAANAQQLEHLVQITGQTQASVTAANVLLTPISDPILELDYRVRCPNSDFGPFCALVVNRPSYYKNSWPVSNITGFGVLNLAFLKNNPVFSENYVYNSDVSFYALPENTELNIKKLKNGEFDIRVDGHMTVNDGGIITSFLQLQDRTMVISAGKSPFGGQIPYYVTVQNRNGQHVAVWHCELNVLRNGPKFALVHKFSETIAKEVMPQDASARGQARDRLNRCLTGR